MNEKDDTIAHLKLREASLEGLLAANDRMHEQDAIVRLQLGKRLEQVLLDKEEAYEELDLFKVTTSTGCRLSVPSHLSSSSSISPDNRLAQFHFCPDVPRHPHRQDKLESIQSAMCIIDFSKSSSITTSSTSSPRS